MICRAELARVAERPQTYPSYDANPAAPVLCHLPGQSTFEDRRFRLEPARRRRIFREESWLGTTHVSTFELVKCPDGKPKTYGENCEDY
jgi:hypothetical protein